MNLRLFRLILLLAPGFAALAPALRAQEAAGEETDKRVQYQLVLPDEKTPENVKPDEHNPFESESEAQNRLAPGDTEENRVRDKLLKLPVVGTKRMTDGRMRVLLGNLILEPGATVPPVLPEQLVELKVKNITAQYIELAWQEKRATGLPPKLMVIPINIEPKVRYQMLGQTAEKGQAAKGPDAIMNLSLRDNTLPIKQSPPPAQAQQNEPPPAGIVTEDAPAATPPAVPAEVASDKTATPAPAPAPAPEAPPAPPPSPAIESMVRMLFGNPTPAPK